MDAKVKMDASPSHPTIVFFQHTETRSTIAVDRETGAIVGLYPVLDDDSRSLSRSDALLVDAVDRYRERVSCPLGYYSRWLGCLT
jgi:hypothetical protein